MYKKLHCLVRLVFALSCIFCLLFSNTLSVKASSGVNNITDIVDFTTPVYQSGDTYVDFKYYITDERSNSSNPFVWHKEITISPQTSTSTLNLDPYKTYCVYMMTNGSGATATPYLGTSGASGTVEGSSIRYKTINGRALSELSGSGNYIYRGYALVQGIELLNGYTNSTNSTCNFLCNVEWYGYMRTGTGTISANPYFAMHLPYNLTVYNLKDGYQYMNTTDMETKRQIQQSEQVIDNTLQEGNEIASDTNETTHSIFDSISSFFGSFFNNLIGVFVPESGYFETWFNRVNTMLADKLGILYYPFNLFISFIQELVSYFSEQQNSCIITFPEISFTNRATNETYVFLQAQQVDLGSYSFSISGSDNSSVVGTSGWTTPVQIIRRLNSIVLFFLFLGLLRQKLNLIIRGEDKDS